MSAGAPAGLRTRDAIDADLDRVVALEARTFPNPWTRKAFEGELKNPFAMLVLLEDEADEALVGFVDYWVVEDELHLLSVAVEPSRQRRGLARFLLALCEADGAEKGAAYSLLEVRVSNDAALALYARAGYREIGRRKRYYSDTGETT